MNHQVPVPLPISLSPYEQEEIQRGFIARVYAWMAVGRFVTAAAALVTVMTPGLLMLIATNRFLFFGLLLTELVLVIALTATINRLAPAVAGVAFAAHRALNAGTPLILVM